MKKICVLLMLCLLMMTCNKDVEPYNIKTEIKVSEIGTTTAKVETMSEEAGFDELDAVLEYSSDEDFSDLKQTEMKWDEDCFMAVASQLEVNTKYYYKVVFTGKYNSTETEVGSFTTLEFKNETITVNGVSFTMIAVEGGTFQMGATSEQGSDASDYEKPVHSVTLSDYYIGETEVTQELWEAVMGTNPSNFKGSKKPVQYVSWNDCQEFITKLNNLTGKNFRLPTEAEWEYAARGGNKSQGYKYSGSNTIGDVAWYSGNSSSTTHDVKTKQANELGIYDMSGNVWEWCQDWFGSYSSGSQTNPTGPSSGSLRVLRGGGWDGSARYCRVSDRYYYDPGSRDDSCGFRLILQ